MTATEIQVDTVLEVALAAHDAGLCVIRCKANGQKRPVAVPGHGRVDPDTGNRRAGWELFTQQRPDRATVESWFRSGHPGVGIVTGRVSGNVEMVELEGRFYDLEFDQVLADRLDEAGVMDIWDRVTAGYCEWTPSGGLHVVHRITDGEVPGNTKLARDIDDNGEIHCLIETRGEGGFTIVAPSHGPVHPTGQPWVRQYGSLDAVAEITMAERDALFAVLVGFDSAPDTPPPPPTSDKRTKVRTFNGSQIGASWFDAVVDHLDRTESTEAVLMRHGWARVPDLDGPDYLALRRPGKEHGMSGWIKNGTGRFTNFSTSAPFATADGAKKEGRRVTTYDALDVISIYEFNGDRNTAARAIADATGIMRQWQAEQNELLRMSGTPTTSVAPDIEPPVITQVMTEAVEPTSLDDDTEIEVVDVNKFFGQQGLLHANLRVAVQEIGPIAGGPGRSLWHYDGGVWLTGGEDEIRRRCRSMLGQRWRKSHVEGVVADLQANRQFITDQQPTSYINCANGLLDWRTGELHDHRPDVASTYQLAVNWNPDAQCPTIDQWLEQVAPDDAINLVWEVFGTAVFPDQPFHRAVLLLGPGRNGKGTFLRLVKNTIGERHVSSVTLQQLAENRFMAAELFGRVANISGDLDARSITRTDLFKMATGGDLISAERKHGQPFHFVNRATMLFSANEAPGSTDMSEGFFSRWVVVPFTKMQLQPGQEDPSIETAMHLELEGALVRAVDGLRRAMDRGGFDLPASVIDATSDYRETSDPIRRFIDDAVTVTGSYADTVERPHVYKLYRAWCEDNGNKPVATQKFYKRLKAVDPRIDLDRVSGGRRQLGGITIDETAVSTWPR